MDLLNILSMGMLLVPLIWLIIIMLRQPKCPKCKTPLESLRYDGKVCCPNPRCKRYNVESYE